jgi:uncharacterized membrane protein YsdA (DUF1294 family)/cold shock CspA family protein
MSMNGIVVKFDAERGFGFIRFRDGGDDVFVHISDVEGRVALTPGQQVTCDVVQTAKGRAAKGVKPGAVAASPSGTFLLVALIIITMGTVGGVYASIPWIFGFLAGVNAATLILYGYDKAVAGGRRLRVPESVLHLLAFVGGTPAAFVSQILFRHKTSKRSFQAVFWLILLAQVGLLVAYVWCWQSRPPWMPGFLQFLFPRR